MRALRDVERNLLMAIESFQGVNGYPPTFRELAKRMGISSSGVQKMLELLWALVAWVPSCSRSVKLTDAGMSVLGGGLGSANQHR